MKMRNGVEMAERVQISINYYKIFFDFDNKILRQI